MRLKLDARTRRLLRRLPVVNVYSAVELVLIAGLATQAARLVWALVTPVSPLGDWRPAEVGVPGRPYDVLTGFDPFFRLGAQAQGPATVTSLQLTLFGIRVDEASGRGSAILAGPDNVQKSIGVGEEIQPGVRLKAVAFDHVTIDRGGTSEDLFLVQSDAPAAGAVPPAPGSPPPGSLVAPAAPAGGAPAIRASQIRNEIGFIPRIDGGRISGLVVRPQGSGALFRTAGLREGDVVTAIGGRPVSGPQDLDRVTADFAGGGNIPITVERGSQTLALALTIAPQ
ncbi:type II secretory protein PulC [Sphingomonas sp. RP10(2022)]|uniref:Type II secretory protein PulC n=1 Tax=Sphingomonas liriopis TaxID=2949094 RepID=A0A9X2HQ98_9SPHN|nr:type II secretion system protein N [Sphingomonas liriopis]MCP3734492.1 type II secretory protein PulC [Sphingomonas liriopis]